MVLNPIIIIFSKIFVEMLKMKNVEIYIDRLGEILSTLT